jgi:hypothetical protein
MRLLLAGLFVFVCIVAALAAVEATVGMEDSPPWLVGPLCLGLSVALAYWLFRERSAGPADRLRALRDELARGARLEPDPALDFRFDFVSTHGDLMDAEAALRRERTGMRGWVRGLALLWAAMLLVPATLAVTVGAVRGNWPQGGAAMGVLVCLVYGGGAVWCLAVRPMLHRRAIRRATAAAQELSLRFTPRGIDCVVAGVGRVRRLWSELGLCLPSRKGVLLAFPDVNNWLPARVFADAAERKRFDACVAHRLAQEAVRLEREPVEHPILAEAGSYVISGVSHEAGSDHLDLSLRRGTEERRLRFLRPARAFWDDELESGVGVLIYLLPHPELDGLVVRAIDAESLGCLEVWAEDVVDLGPDAPPPAARLRP